jgi:DNA-binding NtrC family response regulator
MRTAGGDPSEATFRPRSWPRDEAPLVPALTVLFHPDLDRVGEVAELVELDVPPVALSRARPHFAPPGATARRPLEDRHLSRRPLWIRPEGGGLVLDSGEAGMTVAVDGAPLAGRRRLAPAELDAGVVLVLADRVALLLRRARPVAGEPAPPLGLVGASAAIDELRRGILRVADLATPVLIRGETGTGKELVARAIHAASGRSSRPFVAVNLAAIPPSTAAAELFGHGRGAFTGAVEAHGGYFGHAAGGTLFLDEIGAAPADVQPLLLRALDGGEVQPLGAAAPRRIDVRVVAATDVPLEDAVAAGAFRAPLLHRLQAAQLFVPPLRDRPEDVGRLVAHFLREELAATGDLRRVTRAAQEEHTWIPASLVAGMARYAWPGNVRQLRSVIRQLAIASRGAQRARVDDALARLLEQARGDASAPATRREPGDAELLEALRRHDFAVKDAAATLGVSRSWLYERLKSVAGVRQPGALTLEEIQACRADCGGDVAATARALGVTRRGLRARMRELGIPER